jgi:hypothetical protein
VIVKIVRVLTVALQVAIAAAGVIVIQKSFHFLDATPQLNIDDSIPNVAVALADHVRYGFLASPTQGAQTVDRTHAFFNYGPFYFWVSAGLTWLFGPSLLLYRVLHPIGLVIVTAIALITFRRISQAGAAVLAILLFDLYLTAQVPIARPDIMVSFCVAMMLYSASRAIDSGSRLQWGLTGFWAGSALTTHQIATAIVPAAGLIWLWAEAGTWNAGGTWRERLGRLGSLAGGGIAAALVYLIAIDFRISDLLTLGRAGITHTQTFRENLTMHLDFTWWSLDASTRWFVIIGLAAAAAASIAALAVRTAFSRRVLAFVMPAVVAALAYQLSFGFFEHQASGYGILSQVTTLWAIAALIGVVVPRGIDAGGWLKPAAAAVALVVATGAVAAADRDWLRTKSRQETSALGQVSISDYISQVLAPLPERASVWGSLYYGIESGSRVDLLQFQEALTPALDHKPGLRDRMAPEYLTLGNYEFQDAFAFTLIGQDSALGNFSKMFPSARYRQVKIVSARPYGTTHVYRKFEPAEIGVEPSLAINDGTGRQWSMRASTPLPVTFTKTSPVVAEIHHYSINTHQPALLTEVATLDQAFYAIDLRIDRDSDMQTGFILASTGRELTWHRGQRELPVTPYLTGERRVTVLIDHVGGPLYLSRFEKPGSAVTTFDVVRVRRIVPLASHYAPPAMVPDLAAWTKSSPKVQVRNESGGVVFDGVPPEGLQIDSPPIAVQPGQRLSLTVAVDSPATVTAAVIGGDGLWLAPPAEVPGRLTFDTKTSSRLTISLYARGDVRVPAPITLATVAPRELYVDRVMGCRSPYTHLAELPCARRQ